MSSLSMALFLLKAFRVVVSLESLLAMTWVRVSCRYRTYSTIPSPSLSMVVISTP